MLQKISSLILACFIGTSLLAQKTTSINPNKLLNLLETSTKAPVKDFVEVQTKPSEKDTTKEIPVGETNWTKGYIEAEGVCYLNPQHVANMGKQYAIDLCLSGAEADGRSNLLAMIMAVHIVDTVRVVDKMIEKKITIQTLDGSIKARRVGAPTIIDNMVKVKMRCDIEGERGITNFVEKKGLISPTADATPEQIAEKDKLVKTALDEFKKQGLIADTTKTLPPMVIEIPKSEAANYNPSLLPKLNFKDENGVAHSIDLTKYLNIKDKKVLSVINSTKELVSGSGTLNGIQAIDGVIKDGNINIDMTKFLGKGKIDAKKKKIQAIFKKIGGSLLNVLPIVAAFI